jgi:uncharacterized protein (TIGR00725 family)
MLCGRRNEMDYPVYIGLIGSGSCSYTVRRLAEDMGAEIGRRGWTLVCGGLGGVMEGAAKGCMKNGGNTVGSLPGLTNESANPYIKVPVPTGLGDGRNLLIVRASDVLVAISGGYGTLSEIALALKMNKKVIGLQTWNHIQGIRYVSDPLDAVQEIEKEILRSGFCQKA